MPGAKFRRIMIEGSHSTDLRSKPYAVKIDDWPRIRRGP
jgi:hypothetical protein